MCEEEEQNGCQEAIKLLSIKTHTREVKRLQFEKLFVEQQAIKQQMAQIQEELQQLDEEIDSLENSVPYEAVESAQNNREDASTDRTAQWEAEDVFTGPQRHQYPRELQLESSLTNPVQTRYSVTARALPPEGLLTSSKKGTIEAYFSSTSSNEISRNNINCSASSFKTIPEDVRNNSCNDVTLGRKSYALQPNDAATTGQQPTCYEWTAQINHLLHTAFKLPSFRENQEDIINSTLLQKDVFVIMRTGGGKSLW
jgi:hypothetical protein